jgi:hypothetical protein
MEQVIEGAVEFPVAGVDPEPCGERGPRREKRRREDRRRDGGGREQNPRPAADQPGDQESGNVLRQDRERERDPRSRGPSPLVERERGQEESPSGEVAVPASKALDDQERVPVGE